jgi:hypothetical protein
MNIHLTDKVKTIRVSNAVAVGTTAVNSSVVDTAGADGCRFIVLWGTITDGTPNIKVQQDTVVGFGGAADLQGTSTDAAVTDDNKMSITEIFRPREQFVRCVVTRGGATGAVIDGIVCELYGLINKPVAKDSSVAVQEAWSSPPEGTA